MLNDLVLVRPCVLMLTDWLRQAMRSNVPREKGTYDVCFDAEHSFQTSRQFGSSRFIGRINERGED